MYAGTTIRHGSGKIAGVHQKIDRAARRSIKKYIGSDIFFPSITSILYFEGDNGPDGIKRKSPSVDEPWYYIDPLNNDDCRLINVINDHIINLSVALRADNNARAAFEAAWLAHAVVDGLTPAHHYPIEGKIEELWGKPHYERNSVKDKGIIHGDSSLDTLAKNWEYWGFNGVFTTHIKYEFGVATAITPLKFKNCGPSEYDISNLKKNGFESIFLDAVRNIDSYKMYDELANKGWTVHLANQTKNVLLPEMIKIVALAWYQAIIMSSDK